MKLLPWQDFKNKTFNLLIQTKKIKESINFKTSYYKRIEKLLICQKKSQI